MHQLQPEILTERPLPLTLARPQNRTAHSIEDILASSVDLQQSKSANVQSVCCVDCIWDNDSSELKPDYSHLSLSSSLKQCYDTSELKPDCSHLSCASFLNSIMTPVSCSQTSHNSPPFFSFSFINSIMTPVSCSQTSHTSPFLLLLNSVMTLMSCSQTSHTSPFLLF